VSILFVLVLSFIPIILKITTNGVNNRLISWVCRAITKVVFFAPMKCVAEIVEKVGGQSALAKMCGVRQSAVWNWLNRHGSKGIPPQYVVTVERATGIPRHEIRPDVFPDEGGI